MALQIALYKEMNGLSRKKVREKAEERPSAFCYVLSLTMVRAMRFFFSSTLTTQTFTTSPTFTASEGWRMKRSAMREMCTRPS